MTSDSNIGHTADDAQWTRFNDEFFSVHLYRGAPADALIGGLADEGIELIVDARSGLHTEAGKMKADCDEAGLYYVPASPAEDLSDHTISRYANLALRHKTCVVVDGEAHALLSAIAAERSLKPRSLDEGSVPSPDRSHPTGERDQRSGAEDS